MNQCKDAYPQGALRFDAGQMENSSVQDTCLQGAEGRLSFEHKELDSAWCKVPAHRGWVPASVLDPRSTTVQNEMSLPGGNESPGSGLDTRSIAVHNPRFLFIVDVCQAPDGQNGHSGVLCKMYNNATAFLEPLGLVIAPTPSIYTLINITFEWNSYSVYFPHGQRA